MATISKIIALDSAENQVIEYDLASREFKITVGTRTPITWTRSDVRKTFGVLQAMRRIDSEYSTLQDIA